MEDLTRAEFAQRLSPRPLALYEVKPPNGFNHGWTQINTDKTEKLHFQVLAPNSAFGEQIFPQLLLLQSVSIRTTTSL